MYIKLTKKTLIDLNANQCQVVSISNACSFQGVFRSEQMAFRSNKPQETWTERMLGLTNQVPNFGGLWNR
jgi:hypothetical protein